LLLFLPLVPIIVKRGNELEAVIISACVGLGFATFENSAYFQSSLGTSSVGRYLTANFFHMAATGLIGLAVVRGIQHPRTKGPEALAVFGVIVFAHGLYDALMSIPSLADYSMISMIIYVLLAYQFFHELRGMRIERQETISLTATFLCGVSLIAAVTFIYVCSQLGFQLALRALGSQVLSTALMVVMFLREMPGALMPR
jgi:protease PrsW